MGLVTVDEVAQWLGIDLTGDERSTELLTRFCEAASTKVETWCRRSFEPGSVSAESHTLDASWSAYLNRVPVTSVSLVNCVLSDGSLQEIPVGSYTLELTTGKLSVTVGSGWWSQSGVTQLPTTVIQVSYIGGADTVPDQVKEATIHVVSMLWYAKGRDAAASQQSAGNFTKTLGVDPVSGLPVSAETLLLDYRRILGALV